MALKVKSVEVAAKKFVQRAAVAGGDYSEGVRGTTDQAERAIAAKEAYEAGVTDSIARGAREKGLEKSGNAKWQRKSLAVGAARFPGGVKAGEPDYRAGIGPYLSVLAGLTLPPRGPKGSPENLERVRAITEALRAAKVGG